MPAPFSIHDAAISRLALIIAALLVPLCALAQTKGLPDPRYELKGNVLIQALKGGGYTLLFRHATRATDVTESPDAIVLTDCKTQVPLTELGKAQARSVGEAMRKLGIPLGETIASPFCRTMDTARAIAGSARAENAVLGIAGNSMRETLNFTRLSEIMAVPPQPGTNRVIVGHSNAFDGLAGNPVLQEGEAGIFKIVDRRSVLVARVRVEDWQAYASKVNELTPAERSSAPDSLLQQRGGPLATNLRSGGYTLYIRNASANPARRVNPWSVANANCLSQAGREQAGAVGTAFAALRIAIGDLYASADCRALETALAVTGRTDALRTFAGTGGGTDAAFVAKLITTQGPRDAVRIIVGDGDAFRAVAGPPMLEEGEAAVLRTNDAGGWTIIARLRAADWADLSATAGAAPPKK